MNKPIKLKGKLIEMDKLCSPEILKGNIEAEISLSPPDLSKLKVGDEVLVKCRIEMPLDKHYIDLTDLLGQYATFHNESIVAILPKELPNKQESNEVCGVTEKDQSCECGNILGWESLSQGFKRCKWCRIKSKKEKDWGKHLSDKEVKEKIKELKPNKKPIEKLEAIDTCGMFYKINEIITRLSETKKKIEPIPDKRQLVVDTARTGYGMRVVLFDCVDKINEILKRLNDTLA